MAKRNTILWIGFATLLLTTTALFAGKQVARSHVLYRRAVYYGQRADWYLQRSMYWRRKQEEFMRRAKYYERRNKEVLTEQYCR